MDIHVQHMQGKSRNFRKQMSGLGAGTSRNDVTYGNELRNQPLGKGCLFVCYASYYHTITSVNPLQYKDPKHKQISFFSHLRRRSYYQSSDCLIKSSTQWTNNLNNGQRIFLWNLNFGSIWCPKKGKTCNKTMLHSKYQELSKESLKRRHAYTEDDNNTGCSL